MPKYLVRQNVEYILQVEADDEEQAIQEAMYLELEEWEQAWSQVEVEPEDDSEDARRLAAIDQIIVRNLVPEDA